MLREIFAARVREHRNRLGLSQRAFGKRFDPPVSNPYICAMEKGAHNPTLEQVEKVAAALGMEGTDLLDPRGPDILGVSV